MPTTDRLRVALVGGPMYDHLYELLDPDEVEVVVHADHPTLNRRVAELLAAGERLDVLATHSKYAPSQAAVVARPRRPRRSRRRRAAGRACRRPVPGGGPAALPAATDRRPRPVGAHATGSPRCRRPGTTCSHTTSASASPAASRACSAPSSSWSWAPAASSSTPTGDPPWSPPRPKLRSPLLCRLAAQAPRRPPRMALRPGGRGPARRPGRRGRRLAGGLGRHPGQLRGRAPRTPPLPRRSRPLGELRRLPLMGDPDDLWRPRRRPGPAHPSRRPGGPRARRRRGLDVRPPRGAGRRSRPTTPSTHAAWPSPGRPSTRR